MSTSAISIIPEDSHALTHKQARCDLWFSSIKDIFHEIQYGINPMVDAAAKIFTTLGELRYKNQIHSAEKLQKQLLQHISLFQEHIEQYCYDPDIILASRYVLCATLDEVICNTAWGTQGNWDAFNLLGQTSQHDKDKRFFTILERIQNQPKHYIDLMELMHICLKLGFKGQHRHSAYGLTQLNQISSELYQQIRNTRGEVSNKISPNFYQAKLNETVKANHFFRNTALSLIGTIFICAAITSTFKYLSAVTTHQMMYHLTISNTQK